MKINFHYNIPLFLFVFFFNSLTFSQAQDIQTLDYKEIDSLMYLYYKKRDLDQAIRLMEIGREKAKIDFGEQDSVFAEYTAYLGFFYKKNSQYDKALPFLIQAKNIRERVLGKEHPDFAKALNNLGLLYQKMGNYDKALPAIIQAKDIQEKVLGLEHFAFAQTLNNLALLHQRMGNYEKALPLYIQTKDIFEKTLGLEHPDFATALNNLALLHQKMGNSNKALPLYIQAKNIKEKVLGTEHPDLAIALNNLALLYESMENYEQALLLHIQTKDIFEKTLGINHPSYATALNNLSSLYQKMGNYDEALPLLIQAKDIREKILGAEHPLFANTLNNLASLYQDKKNYNAALDLFIQAKDIRAKVLGTEHPDFAESLNNLAGTYAGMKNYEQALASYIQAKDIREKVLGTEHLLFANSLFNIASLYQEMENYEQAWEFYLKAIQVFSELELNKNINKSWANSLANVDYASNAHLREILSTLYSITFLLQKDTSISNSHQKQILVADLAFQLINKLRNHVLSENDKLRMLNLSNLWLKYNLSILEPSQDASKAFDLSTQNKSVLLFQATKSEETYRIGELPDSLVLQDKKRLKKQSQLQAKLLEQRPKQEKDSLRNLLINLNQEIDDFLLLIKTKYPKYYKLKYQQIQTKAKDIQKLLDDRTALLEYAITDSAVHMFYLDKNTCQWTKSAITHKELNKKIQIFHNSLSNYKLITEYKEDAYRQYTENAHWFYQKLIEPALVNQEHIDNLIIITDGKLGHLPFETFLTTAAPQQVSPYYNLAYLLNDYTISYNYSASLWKENIEAPNPKNNGQILAMAANYSYKSDSSKLENRLISEQELRASLKPLPAARKEVQTLQKAFQGFFAFDSLSTEKMVKKLAPNYAIIHLAMHGILDHQKPVLSSLAFTEDNDSSESNFWQAHEISKIQLNANLIVLSACQTGFGKFETGNGIASLARAFMYAGASSLIVSLWQVNDLATSKIMKNLYENLASGIKKDEALRQAKLQYIQTTKGIAAHPAFWSPFIQIGNTEVVEISKKRTYLIWLMTIGTGSFILFGGLVFIIKKRKKEIA